jgi:hypothetical protein
VTEPTPEDEERVPDTLRVPAPTESPPSGTGTELVLEDGEDWGEDEDYWVDDEDDDFL